MTSKGGAGGTSQVAFLSLIQIQQEYCFSNTLNIIVTCHWFEVREQNVSSYNNLLLNTVGQISPSLDVIVMLLEYECDKCGQGV